MGSTVGQAFIHKRTSPYGTPLTLFQQLSSIPSHCRLDTPASTSRLIKVETPHNVHQTSLNHDNTKHTATKLQHRLGKSLTLTQTHSNRCQIAFLQHNVQLLYSGQLAQMRCSAPSLHSWAWPDQPGTQLWEEVRLVLEKLPEVRLAF